MENNEKTERKFEKPRKSLICEKCGTTNFIYGDMKTPYTCDNCGSHDLIDPRLLIDDGPWGPA